uniref:Uncharacterized protein LOC113791498 isoform X1 n=2 Tax=Dermatophagoides pteronyssinus TaxID=6956 RepID=A0A6P6XUJ9_DERPT|nr:uncharacterized protein LOC113791498 isoform X1 [Dermatophagoides pteronyssinus]
MSMLIEKPTNNTSSSSSSSSTIQHLNNIMKQLYLDRQFPLNLDRQLKADETSAAASTSFNIITTSTPIFSLSPSLSTSSSMTTSSNLEVSFQETLLWSLLFYPMVILAAIGNLLIIWIIATKPLMRNIMNQYLMNLTLSDFLSVTFNASFNFIFMLHQHWPFGKIYCIANNFIANLTIVSSVSTMMLISIDRYYAIVHPLKPRQTKRRFFCSIGAIWTSSILFSLPALLYSDTEDLIQSLSTETFDDDDVVGHDELSLLPFESYNSTNASWFFTMNFLSTTETSVFNTIIDNATLNYLSNQLFQSSSSATSTTIMTTGKKTPSNSKTFETLDHGSSSPIFIRTLCIMRWPDGVSGFSTYEFLYNMAFLIFFYVIPVLTMIVALILMSRVLWPRELIGEHTTIPQNTLIRSKRKVVCMLICVISVFALCWLPYHSYFISIYWWPSLIKTSGIKHIYLAFYWFAMANSLFNPVILFAMNRRIRNYIKHYVKCACCTLTTNKNRKKIFRSINHHHNHNHQQHNNNCQQQTNPMRMLNYHYHYYPNRTNHFNNNNNNHCPHHHHCSQSSKQSQQSGIVGQHLQLQQAIQIEQSTNQIGNQMNNKPWTIQTNGIISNVSLPISLITANSRQHHHHHNNRTNQQVQSQQQQQSSSKTIKKVEFCCSKRDMYTSSDHSSFVPLSDDNDQSSSRMTRLKSETSAIGSKIRNNLNYHPYFLQNDHHSCPSIFFTHNKNNESIDSVGYDDDDDNDDKNNDSPSLKVNISPSLNQSNHKNRQSSIKKSNSMTMENYPSNNGPVSV